MFYAPEIAAKALGLSPLGNPSEKPCQCCLCGRRIDAGDLRVPFIAQSTFMDGRALTGDSRHSCGYCAVHRGKTTMMALQKFCVTESRAWKLYSGANRAWMLRNLPDEPFVFAFSDSKLQHLVWRTPVSLSKEFFKVRCGNRVFSIRREAIFAAYELCVQITGAVEALPGQKKKKAAPKHPFVTVDGALDHFSFGVIRKDLLNHEDPTICELTSRIRDLELDIGEIWLTGILCNYSPEEPEIITLKSK